MCEKFEQKKKKIAEIILKIWTVRFYHRVMHLKDANSVDWSDCSF